MPVGHIHCCNFVHLRVRAREEGEFVLLSIYYFHSFSLLSAWSGGRGLFYGDQICKTIVLYSEIGITLNAVLHTIYHVECVM